MPSLALGDVGAYGRAPGWSIARACDDENHFRVSLLFAFALALGDVGCSSSARSNAAAASACRASTASAWQNGTPQWTFTYFFVTYAMVRPARKILPISSRSGR